MSLVTFDQFNASLLNKSITFFKTNCTELTFLNGIVEDRKVAV